MDCQNSTQRMNSTRDKGELSSQRVVVGDKSNENKLCEIEKRMLVRITTTKGKTIKRKKIMRIFPEGGGKVDSSTGTSCTRQYLALYTMILNRKINLEMKVKDVCPPRQKVPMRNRAETNRDMYKY